MAVDERCEMELDETDPTVWLRLEAATDDYIKKNSMSFRTVCESLLENSHDEKFPDSLKSQQFVKAKGLKSGICAEFLLLSTQRFDSILMFIVLSFEALCVGSAR